MNQTHLNDRTAIVPGGARSSVKFAAIAGSTVTPDTAHYSASKTGVVARTHSDGNDAAHTHSALIP